MTDLLLELVRFLSQDPLTVADVVARVGPVARDPGLPLPVELRPTSPDLHAARLSRYPDSGQPYVLTLEPTPGAQPTVAALRAALGEYRRSLTHRGMPAEVVFSPPAAGPRWRVAVIAALAPLTGDLDGATVTSVALRRDPATP